MRNDKSSQYRAGFLDGFYDHDPLWLGIDWYKIGFEGGQRAAEHPIDPGIVFVSERPCINGVERIYLFEGVEITVRFSFAHLTWDASIPGRSGGAENRVASAIYNLGPTIRAEREAKVRRSA